MDKAAQLDCLLNSGLVAILRAPSGDDLVAVSRALFEGGIDVIEITCTVPGFLEILSQLRKELGSKILLGAGTVLNAETARATLEAGAQFLVSPALSLGVIEVARRENKLVMPGAFTPTEILAAWDAGADLVKLFPADVGGPSYLAAIRGPLPQVRLMATGGVNLQTLPQYFAAGASVVGLGGALVDGRSIRDRDFSGIRERASQFAALMRSVRHRVNE